MTKTYCNDVVRQHPIYRHCHCFINDILQRDKDKARFKGDVECLDMDTYETSIAYGNRDNTMDAVIGTAEIHDNKRLVNKRLSPIEFRLKYRRPDNLETKKMVDKSRRSRTLLSNDIQVDSTDYFIFNDEKFSNFRSWIHRKHQEKKLLNWRFLSASDLREEFQM